MRQKWTRTDVLLCTVVIAFAMNLVAGIAERPLRAQTEAESETNATAALAQEIAQVRQAVEKMVGDTAALAQEVTRANQNIETVARCITAQASDAPSGYLHVVTHKYRRWHIEEKQMKREEEAQPRNLLDF